MNLRDITPLILTFNEEANIGRCLQALHWASQIVVMDSGSTDGTLALLAADPRVRVVHRPFDDASSQCNHGLLEVTTPWVLSLDADYLVTSLWVDEVAGLEVPEGTHGYASGFEYWVMGAALSRSLYPPRTVLYRRAKAHYVQDGHTQRVCIDGGVGGLRSSICHDDRKDIGRWLSSQHRYARQEAEKLLSLPSHQLNLQDRLRRTGWASLPAVLVYTLFWQGLIFDGWRGLHYAWQRLIAECLLALALIERRQRVAVDQRSANGS